MVNRTEKTEQTDIHSKNYTVHIAAAKINTKELLVPAWINLVGTNHCKPIYRLDRRNRVRVSVFRANN